MTVFCDTSAWFALLTRNDSQYPVARRRFARLASERRAIITTNHVISETYTLLRSRLGAHPALRFLEQMRVDSQITRVQVTNEWEAEAEQLLSRYDDQRFSYVDATSFVTMRHFGLHDALTCDRDFAIAGFAIVGDR